MHPPPVLLLAPIEPAPTGNGLAMRCGVYVDALSSDDLHVVVVPVAGRVVVPGARPDRSWLAQRCQTVATVDLPMRIDPQQVVSFVGDPRWRERLGVVESIPTARMAHPGAVGLLAAEMSASLRRSAPTIVAVRASLWPLAAALAEGIGASGLVVDLDDDDERFLAATGDDVQSAAHRGLVDQFASTADCVLLASAADAVAVEQRHPGLRSHHVPNVVRTPRRDATRRVVSGSDTSRTDTGAVRLLFVGNLTYGPNIDAARRLVTEVAPAVRARLGNRVIEVHLVGRASSGVLALRAEDGVVVHGQVPVLDDHYRRASVVVAPLDAGSGSRIKLLEAFAHGVPVLSTAVGAEGLAVADQRECRLVTDVGEVDEMAQIVCTMLSDPLATGAMVERARSWVVEHHGVERVGALVRRLVVGGAHANPRDVVSDPG